MVVLWVFFFTLTAAAEVAAPTAALVACVQDSVRCLVVFVIYVQLAAAAAAALLACV